MDSGYKASIAHKKYRRPSPATMIIKPKNNSKRKEQSSKEHSSHIRSTSRSQDKHKQRSNSKQALRLKVHDQSSEETNSGHSNALSHRIGLKKNKSAKEADQADEYYNHFRGKSKSKGKLQAPIDEPSRVKYMNSIYMHKDANAGNSSQLDHTQKDHPKQFPEKKETTASSAILQKFKMLERNCGIDSNGRIMPK
jgi:hypothetical protein